MAKPRDEASVGGENSETAHQGVEGPSVAAQQEIASALDADAVTLALQTLSGETPLADDAGLAGDNDLLAAVQEADAASGLEHVLDQLTHATDLFDIAVADFGGDCTES